MHNRESEHAWMRFYQLLRQGVDPHPSLTNEVKSLRGPLGQSILHWLCLEADVAIIERALKAGVELDAQDELGNTPLMEAATAGRTDVIPVLIAAGASRTITNFDGEDLADYLDLYGLDLTDLLP